MQRRSHHDAAADFYLRSDCWSSHRCVPVSLGYDDTTGNPSAIARRPADLRPVVWWSRCVDPRDCAAFWSAMARDHRSGGYVWNHPGRRGRSIAVQRVIPRYRYWAEMLQPTLIKPLGFGAYNAMNFIVGHVIWSYCIPIALVESLCPALSDQPWLRRSGFITTALLYLGAAALILSDHLQNEKDHASLPQIAGSLVRRRTLEGFRIHHRPPSDSNPRHRRAEAHQWSVP